MTVSQAREVYPSTRGGGGYDKALVPVDPKMKERTFHYLQVCVFVDINLVILLCIDLYLLNYSIFSFLAFLHTFGHYLDALQDTLWLINEF